VSGGFTTEWLALREPYDAAARDPALTALLPLPPAGSPRRIVDLAAGTGANLRYLAPLLGGRQEWLLVDHDRALLEAASGALGTWALRREAKITERDRELEIRGRGFECRVSLLACDLASELGALALPHGALVACSALLDLVGETWLTALAQRCAAAGAAIAFALTYDGRLSAEPADNYDAAALELFNRHQRSDKGFGPALGPSAAAAAEKIFTRLGYVLTARASDWRLGPAAGELQRSLLKAWCDAALEIEPASAPELTAWLERRLEHVARGGSALQVGHVDLVGRPGG
jgi:hypothetical protein